MKKQITIERRIEKNMKMKTKNRMPMLVTLGILGLLLGMSIVAAYPRFVGVGISDEDHTAMKNAIENNDYSTWKSLMTAQLTEERFQKMATRHNAMQQRHEDVEAALESKDYGAWVEAMSENGNSPRILEYVNEDNFGTFVELHEAHENGDMDKVMELSGELGFPMLGGGQKMGRMHR